MENVFRITSTTLSATFPMKIHLIGQLLDQWNLTCICCADIALSNSENRRSLSCSYQKLFAIKDCRVTSGPPCTLRKKGTLPNPPKRFGRCEKACKCVQSFKKRIKKSTKPLKDLPVYPGEDPFFLETFLSSVEQKKDFLGKYETFKVSY